MIWSLNETVSPKDLADLREAVGWNRMEREYADPRTASDEHIAVYRDGRLIGYVGCVSNGVTDAYIRDLMVHPAAQGRGIGTELMRRMIARLKEEGVCVISVLYEESLQPFYARFGFMPLCGGQMETDRG